MLAQVTEPVEKKGPRVSPPSYHEYSFLTRATLEVYLLLAEMFSEGRSSVIGDRRKLGIFFVLDSRRVPKPWDFSSRGCFVFLSVVFFWGRS